MAKILTSIDDDLRTWIRNQKIFFVGSAPLSPHGHVNISPKGGDSFIVLGDKQVAYCDFTGSGIETASHVQENGRMVIMFCAFDGPPKIVRLHGTGRVIKMGDEGFDRLRSRFPTHIGTRLIVQLDVTRIAGSCGYSVPMYQYLGDRDVLDKWSESKGEQGLKQYRLEKNALSIDGLPGM